MTDPKHTDTSCSGDHNGPEQTFHDTERNLRDRIEALEAENERLRDVLEEIAGAHLERVGYCQTDIDEVPDLTAREAMSAARAALERIDND